MYLRNSTHSAGATLAQANPSPPPSAAFGSPAEPVIAGNGNQPRNPARAALSTATASRVPLFQSPMSSIAALPLASRPFALVGSAWPGVAMKLGWNGLVSMKALRSWPAFTKHGSSKTRSTDAFFKVSTEQARSPKLYHQCAAGHLSPAPTAIGTTLIALSLTTASFSSANVVGGAAMPACVNSCLLYQTPSMPIRYGRPYCLPSTCQMPAALPMLATSALVCSVMSLRYPASTCSRISPPPHAWKMSGGSSVSSAAGIRVRCSWLVSIASIWIVTDGWSLLKSLATLDQ